jgi:acyl-CoA thioesterase
MSETDASTPAPTPLSTLLARRVRKENVVHYVVTPDWMQGRTTFGGLTAALAVQAIRDVASAEWPLRTVQASFIGPVGGETAVEVKLLRKGRNMEQVQATVVSGGETAAIVLVAFGKGRETIVPTRVPQAHAVKATVEEALELPFMPGFSPNFLQHLRSRWAEGEFPFASRENWLSRIYTRLRDESVHGELTAVMLADMPPTPLLSFFDRRVPASSVSWELELVPFTPPAGNDGWFRVDTDAITAVEGYTSQRTTLWAPGGGLAALGYQVVGVYG